MRKIKITEEQLMDLCKNETSNNTVGHIDKTIS